MPEDSLACGYVELKDGKLTKLEMVRAFSFLLPAGDTGVNCLVDDVHVILQAGPTGCE